MHQRNLTLFIQSINCFDLKIEYIPFQYRMIIKRNSSTEFIEKIPENWIFLRDVMNKEIFAFLHIFDAGFIDEIKRDSIWAVEISSLDKKFNGNWIEACVSAPFVLKCENVSHRHYSIKYVFRRGHYFTAYTNHFITCLWSD